LFTKLPPALFRQINVQADASLRLAIAPEEAFELAIACEGFQARA